MARIFISYRREDSEHATGRLYDRLEPHFGRENVFLDVDTIPFGVDFREHLGEAVGRCDLLLAVIGEQWLEARHPSGPRAGQRRLDDPADLVRVEIEAALKRGIPVIPVLVGKATVPAEQELPEGLKSLAFRNAAEVRSGRDFRDHVDRLIHGIDYLLKQGRGATGMSGERPPHGTLVEPVLVPVSNSLLGPPREVVNSIGIKFVQIPEGAFLMGSPVGEGGDDEQPQHEIEITRPFYLGACPVTQEQYQRITGKNPSWFCSTGIGKDQVKDVDTGLFPVESVSWEEAKAFCDALSILPQEKKAGRTYRLPTEAQWEYACRGGATAYAAYHFGQTLFPTQANCSDTQLGRPCRVASYPANAFGLFDMHGNVWEWCLDWYDAGYYRGGPRRDPQGPDRGDRRVLRGGSWNRGALICRSARRYRAASMTATATSASGSSAFRPCTLDEAPTSPG